MDILNLKNPFDLALETMKYRICHHCGAVDKNEKRAERTFLCPQCHLESGGSLAFYDVSVLMMLELLRESYHSADAIPETREDWGFKREQTHHAAVITFFNTIKEILLERFILHHLDANQIPANLQLRMLSDNDSHSRRLNRLLPSLIGHKWNIIVSQIDTPEETYGKLDKFLEESSRARNELLHEGAIQKIDRNLSTRCMEHIPTLLELYVVLHNKYVHPLKLEWLKTK
jgi:hypothetical protein